MRKIYLLILTLVLIQGALFAQTYPGLTTGDYKTKTIASSYSWDATSLSWQKYNGSTWDDTNDIPGISPAGNITYNVYITKTTFLKTTVTIGTAGKIWVRDNGIVTLNVGYYTLAMGLINNYGSIDIQSGANAGLRIFDNSSIGVFSGGSILDNSGGKITSNATTCIVIHSESGLPNGSVITGSTVKGTYEQFIPGGKWHIISPPMDGVKASDFYDANSVYIRPYITPNGGWGTYIEDVGTDIYAKKGYLVWETVDFTFSKSGTFLTGNQNLPFVSGGWNLLGNPYPSGLKWNSVAWGNNDARDKLDGVNIYIYDPTSNTYLTRNHWGAGTLLSDIIPPFQGFFVYAYADGNLALDKAMLAQSETELYKSTNVDSFTNHIMLEADFKGQKSYTISYQLDIATNGKDRVEDAPMLFSGSDDIMEVYSFADDNQTCINAYGEYPYVMELGFKVPAEGGDITLTPTDFRNFDPMLSVSLQDTETGAYFDFLTTPTYTFTVTGGDVTDRIYLIMNNNVGIKDIDKNSIQIFSNRNAVYLGYSDLQFSGELKIYNLLGQTVYQSKLTNNNYKPIYLNQPSAYYIVELITDNESITQKVFIQQ